MHQQVNLAKYISLPIKSPLDMRRLMIFYGIFLLFLMFVYLGMLSLKSHQVAKYNELKITLDNAKQELIQTAAKYPQSQASIKYLNTSLFSICNVKFSAYLEGFAKAAVPGVWLTDINVSNHGKEISLKGFALKATQAQQYLIQLKNLSVFDKLTFELKELTETTESSDTEKTSSKPLNFQLTAKASS